MLEDIHPRDLARIRLEAWRECSYWLDYCAAEFVPDAATRGYLEHVGVCVRQESERRFATLAGFTPSVAA